ncbi:MAG: Gldg family protein, partial [Lachnospiraceae bacterium]
RILAEERKQKTDQLTLTAPVSIGKIVTGKYLAMATVLFIPVMLIGTYPLLLSCFGEVALAQQYNAILGFFLYGLAAAAVGLFLSSLTESQVIAAVISFAALFITYMMDGIRSLLSGTDNVIVKFVSTILSAFDFSSRFDKLLNGKFDVTAVVYFLTVIFICLFLTTQSIQKRRYSISVKNIRFGAYSSGLIVIVLAASVFFNLLVNELPGKYTGFDLTSQNLYTFTDTTKDFLQNLEEDINIYVLQDENNKDELLDTTLREYEQYSSHIKVSYKNPVDYPNFYQQYTDGNISMNSLIIEGSKRYKVINYSDIYEKEIDYSTYQQVTTGYDGEGKITSALDYVTKDNMPKAYMIEGHNEIPLDNGFEDAIEKQNITLETLNLISTDEIPKDAEFVMILAPSDDYSSDDAQKVIQYIENGGKLIMTTSLIENYEQEMPNFQKILDCFSVDIVNGIVIEPDSGYYYQEPTYLLPEVAYSTYTDGVYQNKYVFMPYAQGLKVEETDDITYTSILTTSENAYSKVDIANAQNYEKTENDIEGPFDLGICVERTYQDEAAKLFLFSSVNIFTDNADAMVANANLTIFTNCISDFSDSEESAIAVPVKSYGTEMIVINSKTALIIGLTIVVVIPIGLLIAGLMIWQKRRKK